jgi:SNF2 family DNA or RNA helicase
MAGALGRAQAAATGGPAQRGRAPGQDRIRLLADLTKARQRIAAAKVPNTIEFVEGVVAQGEKVIVFSAFDAPVQAIAKHFGEAAVRLTGATPVAKRQEIVDRFQGDDSVRVMVANLIAGGVGVNLTAARQVVFNDLDWVPANHWQAEDRAYRIGQRGTVNVTYFEAKGTVDEFVSRALATKTALIGAVIDGTGIPASGGDLLTDLEELVRALSPALASVTDEQSGEDSVDRFLRQAVAAMEAGAAGAGSPARAERSRRGSRPGSARCSRFRATPKNL